MSPSENDDRSWDRYVISARMSSRLTFDGDVTGGTASRSSVNFDTLIAGYEKSLLCFPDLKIRAERRIKSPRTGSFGRDSLVF